MDRNERRRLRYRADPAYRQRCMQAALARKARLRSDRDRLRRMHGWEPIHTAPENEVIKLYDPAIFFPVYAEMKNGVWVGIHYEGRINPTYWMRCEKVPR